MKAFKELRKDPHRPSSMDPAEYVFVGAADDHPDPYGRQSSYVEVRHDILAGHGVKTGNRNRHSLEGVPFYDATEDGRPNYRCHHCGKHGSNIRYFCFFLHKPSKQVIVVGQICAERFNLGTKRERDFQPRRDEFYREQEEVGWIDDHPEEYKFLQAYHEHHEHGGKFIEFLSSLWDQIQRKGQLSDKQVEALRKWMARDQEWTRQQIIDPDRHHAEVVHTEDAPTQPQKDYIYDLLGVLNKTVKMPPTRGQASDLINTLKAEVIERHGSLQAAPAFRRQVTAINRLMQERSMPLEQRREARQRLDNGLTMGQALAWIERLKSLPTI